MRVAILSLAATALLSAGCGQDAVPSGQGAADQAQVGTPPGSLVAGLFAGTLAEPRKASPPLALRNSLGQLVDLKRYRGKAVLVTFIYSDCPDVCPLIVGNLRNVQAELGQDAKDLQIIAVSVDPEGDTPDDVNEFLRARRMTGRMQYLIGSRPELEKVWSDWGIVSRSSPMKNDPDYIEHSAMVYGIDSKGRITTLYPTSFRPGEIAYDVPILASQ